MTATFSASERQMVADAVTAIFAAADADATAALVEFGIDDLVASDRQQLGTVFGIQGSTASTSSLLNRVMASALGSAFGELIDLGSSVASLVAPPAIVDGGRLSFAGVAMRTGDGGRVIVGDDRPGGVVAVVDVRAAGVRVRPLQGIDPALCMSAVTAEGVVPDRLIVGTDAAAAWRNALLWGRAALAAELVGCARRVLGIASEYANHRVQFGRPIGSFQAVKHRLANALIAIEAADASVEAVLLRPTALSAMVAKSAAGRAARGAADQALQVLGAIGFTLEHPFHRYQRRCLALDRLFGSSDELPRAIGAELLRTGNVPIIIGLDDLDHPG